MNHWGALLGWLDEQGITDWERVKSASKALSAARLVEQPNWRGANWSPREHAAFWAKPLIQIGHAEYIEEEQKVAVCPKGMVWLEDNQRAVLFGYWRKEHRETLEQFDLSITKDDPKKGPTCWYVSGTVDNVKQAAKQLGVWLSPDPGISILERLPIVNKLLIGLPKDDSPSDGNWEQLFFDCHRCKWQSDSEPFSEPGLYRRRSGQRQYVLVKDDYIRVTLTTRDQRSAAIWSRFAPRLYRFDADRRTLLIPAVWDLPLLLSRALTTRSAQIPRRIRVDNKDWWQFSDVDQHKAQQVARIMRCNLVSGAQ
jgi:hypothetical protein